MSTTVNWITLIPFLSFISYLIILISSFENWRQTRQGSLFAIYLFIISIDSFSSWFMHRGAAPSPLFWFQIELATVFLIQPLILHFAMEFPRPREKAKKWIYLWYLPSFILGYLLISGKLIKSFRFLPEQSGQVIVEFYPAMIILWISATLTMLATLIIYMYSYFKEKYPNKVIVLFPFAGSLLLLSGGLLNLSPVLRGFPVEFIGNFFYSILVAYAILRYQFVSPGAIFRKSSVFALTSLIINIIFIIILFNIISLIKEMPVWQLWLLFLPFAIFAVSVTTLLRQRVQDWLDRIFFGEQYSYRITIEDFSKKAASSLNLKELTSSLVAMLNKVFKCPVSLFIAEKEGSLSLAEAAGYQGRQPEPFFVLARNPIVENRIAAGKPFHVSIINIATGPAGIMASDFKWLDTVESELVCPLISKDKLTGIIVLGKKKGLYSYSDEDISLLSALSSHTAIALDNARLYLEAQEAYKGLKEAQEHLMHSERMRLLGEVSSGVAHDLNNLLAVISARAEMNLALIENPQAHRNMELILKATEDSAKVVKRLREFVIKPKDIVQDKLDVNKVITELLPMVEHRRSEIEQTRGVFFELDYKLQARNDIMGDSSDIRQAMVGILFNAFDAMPNGGKIEIVSQDRGLWVVISISDTGIGMTPEVKEKIFKPFFSTKGDKGSGLGLSIAQGIVNTYRGKLTFDSEVGKGTTFYLSFPAASQAVVTDKAEVKEPARNGKAQRILVIEDNKELGESIVFFLDQAGYFASLATGGNEGLARFKQDSFNLVVTDWGLSPMTGGEVALSIKAIKPDVPVVVITGWELNISPTSMRDMGIVDVIIKPFNREEFLARIAKVINENI